MRWASPSICGCQPSQPQIRFLGADSVCRGPNWIYTASGEAHPIMKLANRTNSPLHLWNDDIRLFDSDGNSVEPSRALKLQRLIWGIFEESFAYSVEHSSEISAADSLYDYVRNCLAELDVPDQDRRTIAQLSQLWGDYIGDPITRQSLKYVWMEVVCTGGACISASKV